MDSSLSCSLILSIRIVKDQHQSNSRKIYHNWLEMLNLNEFGVVVSGDKALVGRDGSYFIFSVII